MAKPQVRGRFSPEQDEDQTALASAGPMIKGQIWGRVIVGKPARKVIKMTQRRSNRTMAMGLCAAFLALSACVACSNSQASVPTPMPAPAAVQASSALPPITLATERNEKAFLTAVDGAHPELRKSFGAAAGPATDATLLSLGDSVLFYAQSWQREQIVATFGDSWHLTNDQSVWFVDNTLTHLKAK